MVMGILRIQILTRYATALLQYEWGGNATLNMATTVKDGCFQKKKPTLFPPLTSYLVKNS